MTLTTRFVLGLCASLLLFTAFRIAWAVEYISDEQPPPESVDQSSTPLEIAFQPKPKETGLFPALQKTLQTAPPFVRDTALSLQFRTYDFERERYDGSHNQAWAGGGALSYQSGWLLNRLALGSVLYTSQPLIAPQDRDGSGLLKPGQEGYTVLGQAYAQVKLADRQILKLFRSEYDTPFINKFDGRMTPKTFEGYTFQGSLGGENGAASWKYGGGYIDKVKDRNSDQFVWMSNALGVDAHRGVTLAGALFQNGDFSAGAIDYYSKDLLNIGYGESRYTFHPTEAVGLLFGLQYIEQRSVSENLTGSVFNKNQIGIQMESSYAGGILTMAYSRDTKGGDLQSPWGGYPGYTTVQVDDFNRAGEETVVSGVSLNFDRIGLPGFSAAILGAHGWARIDPATGNAVPNENEFDLDLQWRPAWEMFRGLWLRARYGWVHQYEGPGQNQREIRLSANYNFVVL